MERIADLLWSLTCFAGYFFSVLFVVLLTYRLRAILWGQHTSRSSWITFLFFAILAGALVLPCYVDLSFRPSPARW